MLSWSCAVLSCAVLCCVKEPQSAFQLCLMPEMHCRSLAVILSDMQLKRWAVLCYAPCPPGFATVLAS